jgi:hypothetical protein
VRDGGLIRGREPGGAIERVTHERERPTAALDGADELLACLPEDEVGVTAQRAVGFPADDQEDAG